MSIVPIQLPYGLWAERIPPYLHRTHVRGREPGF